MKLYSKKCDSRSGDAKKVLQEAFPDLEVYEVDDPPEGINSLPALVLDIDEGEVIYQGKDIEQLLMIWRSFGLMED